MTSTYGPIRRFRDGNRYSLSSNQKAVSLPEGNNCKTTSIRGLSAVGEHLLGDYPTVGSNGLESRTTKSEFFWVYFGVFLALGFGGVAERPKTLIINLSQNHPPQRRRAAGTAHPEQVSRTVESDQSSTLLPLSDLKTGCGLHEKWARTRITTELCPQKDRKVGKVPRVPNPGARRAHREQLRLETLEEAEGG